MQHQY